MKNFKGTVLRTLSLAIILVSSFSLSFANEGLNIIPVSGNSKVVISFGNFNSEKVVLSIEDSAEEVVYYSEKINNTSAFSKVYDLSALKDGEYTILVKTDSDIIKTPVSISNSKVTTKVNKEIAEPTFRLSDNILFVFFTNKEGENYAINFTDESGNFFSDFTSELSVVKRYDLSKLPIGEYTVLVSNNENTFAYSISK